MQLEEKLAKTLINQQLTLSIAESCTGGLVSNRLTNIPGSSAFLHFSVIAYDNRAKTNILNVSLKTLKQYGAVSQQTARAMAQGIRKILKSDISLSITGIAGPSGGSPDKPVGTVFMAICFRNKVIDYQFMFKGSRTSIKKQAAEKALNLLIHLVNQSKRV